MGYHALRPVIHTPDSKTQAGMELAHLFPNKPDWLTSGLVQIVVMVFLTLTFHFILRRLLNRLHHKALDSHAYWDDAFVTALQRPLAFLVLFIGLSLVLDTVQQQAERAFFPALDPVRRLGVVFLFAWFLIRLIREGEGAMIAKYEDTGETCDRATMEAVAKLLRLSVTVIATLVILQTLGVSVAGVLAFGGIGGLAIGFAAKDLLANFFGGLMLYLERPFVVGDWIRSPDREIEGDVEQIGWRLTRIRTFDKRPLYVPNAIFTTIAVENPSRMSNRRIYETIGIRYDDANKMEPIVQAVEHMLRTHPEIDTSRILMVNFNAFAPSSLDFFVYTFTKTTRWTHYHKVKQDVLLKILEIIKSHGAQAAFPTSTLHIPEGLSVQPAGSAEECLPPKPAVS